MLPNPYDNLGLDPSSTCVQVKARYIKLAKQHHPDKLPPSLSDEERQHHEEKFKEITAAYRQIQESHGGSDEDTISMWKRVFHDTVTEIKKRYHTVHVPVTLEEVHARKSKKLELFLRGMTDPVYLRVNCGMYPKCSMIHEGHLIRVKMDLQPHTVYHLDNVLGTNDLYSSCDIHWHEYLQGLDTFIPWCDGRSSISLNIPAFARLDVPLVFEEKGLWGEGNLYVKLRLVPPDSELWQNLEGGLKETILNGLDAARPRCENPKTI